LSRPIIGRNSLALKSTEAIITMSSPHCTKNI
jgi:hypothetical protein